MTPDVAEAILTSQQHKSQQQEQEIVGGQDKSQEIDDDGPCWYEVIERFSDANQSSLGSDESNGERVIALFPTKKEALDCVRIKQSFRKGGDDEGGDSNDRFFVRRRWNA